MLRVLLIVVGLALVLAIPIDKRTDEEIQTYRRFLESFKSKNATQDASRRMLSPLANPEEHSDHLQGDIKVDDHLIDALVQRYSTRRIDTRGKNLRWPNNTVIWAFGKGYLSPPQKQSVYLAMAEIESRTCIKFRLRHPGEITYVRITNKPEGCISDIGYIERRLVHEMNLASDDPGVGCFRPVRIIHEWMHVLGFHHMHSVHDRDNYVKILWENIKPGSERNFIKLDPADSFHLNVEYDYESCMHYTPYAFSANGNKTMVPLHEFEGEMGQRDYVTDKDWLRINRYYNCPGAWD